MTDKNSPQGDGDHFPSFKTTEEVMKGPFTASSIWSSIPVCFADGVMSQSFGPGISKFYLYRTDADPHASPAPNVLTPVAQIVMPIAGFVRSHAFMGKRIQKMVADGFISQEEVDRLTALAVSEP